MAALTRKDVEHVALLSRLELGEEEITRAAEELTKIFAYAEDLDEVDVSGVAPSPHPLPIRNVLREDVARPGLSNQQALANAPEQEDGCFKVPQIV